MNEDQLMRHLRDNLQSHIQFMFESLLQTGLDQNQIFYMLYKFVITYQKDNLAQVIPSELSDLDYQMEPVLVQNEGSSQYVVSSFLPLFQHMQDLLVYVKPEDVLAIFQEKKLLITSYQKILRDISVDGACYRALMESKEHNGCYYWKIPDFSYHFQGPTSGQVTSPPFYSSFCGYKMCLRVYLCGDGIGKGTHISLFVVIMKGEFDDILEWPFSLPITLKLLNRIEGENVSFYLRPDPGSSSFQKPVSCMNVAFGCPKFADIFSVLNAFVHNDSISFYTEVGSASLED